jgi:beta-glucuronidase
LLWYEGTIWYKRDFDYRMAVGRRVYVYFGAANYDAKVYLNGTKLGEHQGGFTPFCFEITDRLRERDNFLVVKVDNQRRPEAVPTVNTDWWNYGGLTRDVMLVDVPETLRTRLLHPTGTGRGQRGGRLAAAQRSRGRAAGDSPDP